MNILGKMKKRHEANKWSHREEHHRCSMWVLTVFVILVVWAFFVLFPLKPVHAQSYSSGFAAGQSSGMATGIAAGAAAADADNSSGKSYSSTTLTRPKDIKFRSLKMCYKANSGAFSMNQPGFNKCEADLITENTKDGWWLYGSPITYGNYDSYSTLIFMRF